MKMEKIKLHKYENNPEWDSMEIQGKWTTWDISSLSDGDVEISCTSDNSSEHLFLNQDELRQVIAFLQTKLR